MTNDFCTFFTSSASNNQKTKERSKEKTLKLERENLENLEEKTTTN